MKSRRQFLARTTAAAVVGSIPAKSVWANGIVNSIVASGHGSDFTYDREIKLLRPCSINQLLKDNIVSSVDLDLNFLSTFGEGPDKKFSEILDCHCGCPPTIRHAISNVVFLVQNSNGTTERFKIDSYGSAHYEEKNPSHPTGYYAAIESHYGSGWTVIDYVIKGGSKQFNPAGEDITNNWPTWYTGWSGSHINGSVNASALQYGTATSSTDNCDGDETTTLMIAIFLNAMFDYYLRGSSDPQTWDGMYGIFYPVLRYPATDTDVANLIASIVSSQTKNDLATIFATYGVAETPQSCS